MTLQGKDAAGWVGLGGPSASHLGAFQTGPALRLPSSACAVCRRAAEGEGALRHPLPAWPGEYYFFFFCGCLKGAGEAECGEHGEKVPSREREAALGSRSEVGHSLR